VARRDACKDLARTRLLLNFSKALHLRKEYMEHWQRDATVRPKTAWLGIQFICFEVTDTEKLHLLEKNTELARKHEKKN